jgi:hypothetical protein
MDQIVSNQDSRPHPTHAPSLWHCPFYHPAAASCQAAIPARTPPREVRATACGCGDYEGCTTFLARLLNRPRR